ncbi:hypothetical protein [Paracoccus sp. IB05]|uniref:hypothetical protein n=1 Tax=Paracoccus sp. IB05 TaxID=2779367 RepID=UPI0018E71517|nr:hypothetical protein [Paracoccus sp. IB05]MBJ2150939.1 hypothetical protein [Paracoccus sp. IB05]
MSGPERIWAWEGDDQDGWANAYATTTHVAIDQVEYLRADGETRIEELAELIYLRHCHEKHWLGARWEANESKDVWHDKARAALAKIGE